MISYSDFTDLVHFYKKLDPLLPGLPGENPCGTCMECCKYLFYLSKYEFDYLESAVKSKNLPFSIRFVTLLPGESDERFFQNQGVCPLRDGSSGCCAYEARPLACRLMGPYIPYNSDPIFGCVFRNPVIYHRVEEIPLWDDLVKILRKYPSLPGYFRREKPHTADC